jgi:WD40 repeat protein
MTLPTAADAATPTRPGAGQLAIGRVSVPGYEILTELGRGGMGVVFLARQARPNRLVALKMILSLQAGEVHLDRFRREAEVLARLQHPNIVAIYEVGEHDGLPFFSLEYCPGGPLDKKLNGTPLPPRQAAGLVETLARAMQASHANGILHRDLKPGNVLLAAYSPADASDEVPARQCAAEAFIPKITDFGLAKRLDEQGQTQTGSIIGTPSYMAPEQAQGRNREVTAAADIWALGAILYELLTGRPPFKAATQVDTILQVVQDEPVPPHRLARGVPRDLETICLKCLRKSPAMRYDGAVALADDLQRFQAGEPIRARPIGWLERTGRWARRRPAAAALAAVLVLGTLGILAGSAWFAGKLRVERDLAEAARADADDKAWEARQGQRLLRRHLYASQMKLAQSAWQDADISRLRELLRAQRPGADGEDLRGFEWHYLWRLAHSELSTFRGHGAGVHCVAFSPDGQRIASGDDGGVLKVWEALTGSECFSIREKGPISALAFSPDGKILVSAAGQREIQLRDATTGQVRRTLAGHPDVVKSLAFSRDGSRLASASIDGTVKVWEPGGPREPFSFKGCPGGVTAVASSADGARIAGACRDNKVRVWEASTGREVLVGDHVQPLGVAFSPDGTRLASGGIDQTIRLWNVQKGWLIGTCQGHTGFVQDVAFSPDGSRIASAGAYDQTVRLWDAHSCDELFRLRGHTGEVRAIAFSPDGRRLASASLDGTVKLWDAGAGPESLELKGHTRLAIGIAFGPDGRLASASMDTSVRLWSPELAQQVHAFFGHTGEVFSVAFGAGGKLLASAAKDGTVRLWKADTGEPIRTLRLPTQAARRLVFSPDGKLLAGAVMDGTVRLWEVERGAERFSLPHGGEALAVAFSPDGALLASAGGAAGRDGDVKVWDTQTGQLRYTRRGFGCHFVHAVAFSPDGAHLACAGNTEVKILNAATGEEETSLRGHTARITSIAYSPDGTRLASASISSVIKLWDLRTDTEVLALRVSGGWVQEVAFSPDGRHLASAGDAVLIWDASPPVPPAEQIAELRRERAEVERRLNALGPARRTGVNRRGHRYGTGAWQIEGRELIQTHRGEGHALLLLGDPGWADHDFEVEAMRIAGPEGFGIAFRAADDRNMLLAVLGGWGNKHGAVECWTDGTPQLLTKQTSTSIASGRWYRLRVEARGNRFRCLVDGKVALELQDDRRPRGRVGVRTNWSTAVRFRNLKVTAPDGKVLFEGLPGLEPTKVELLDDQASRLRARIAELEARRGVPVNRLPGPGQDR